MTAPDIDALERAAQTEAQGKWASKVERWRSALDFHRASRPAAILPLIAEVRELTRQRDEARAALEAIVPDGLAHVVGDRLIIAWTLDGLAVGSTTGPYFDRIFAETAEEPVITDKVMWGHELTRKLNEESEDGTTAIHRMMDGAAERAFEDGAEGIEVRSRSALPPPAGSEPAP